MDFQFVGILLIITYTGSVLVFFLFVVLILHKIEYSELIIKSSIIVYLISLMIGFILFSFVPLLNLVEICSDRSKLTELYHFNKSNAEKAKSGITVSDWCDIDLQGYIIGSFENLLKLESIDIFRQETAIIVLLGFYLYIVLRACIHIVKPLQPAEIRRQRHNDQLLKKLRRQNDQRYQENKRRRKRYKT